MAASSPQRTRVFTIEAETTSAFDVQDFAPRTRGLKVEVASVRTGRVRISGSYTVHGNSEHDLRQMAVRAGLENVEVSTTSVRPDPCGDLGCGGCSRIREPQSCHCPTGTCWHRGRVICRQNSESLVT